MRLLSLLATGFGLGASIVVAAPMADNGTLPHPVTAPTVTLKNGTYSGIYSSEYDQDYFLGMPYARKPIRFSNSQYLNSTWDGIKEATAYPKHCIGYGGDEVGYDLSEDCLYINVVRPAGISDTADLPVAVWIHGGGLYMGGSADRRYNLSFIVDNSVKQGTPLVAVSFNYRLSAFGFLPGSQALAEGVTNIGFRDQRLALRWINENIQSFGGSPDLVTIFGESSGAESVSAQVLAYNGRDDGLFRGAIGQSGFGGLVPRYAGGFNATTAQQELFDTLLTNTSCASTVGTQESIACLRNAPFEEINYVLNVTGLGPWPPILDHDFFADYPYNQLRDGKFPKIPVLIGANTDEGTAFGRGHGPNGSVINTDADFEYAVRDIINENVTLSTGKTVDEIVEKIMSLYPNIQSEGIPSLESWPQVITANLTYTAELGLQYRRINALYGDYFMHDPRRRSSIAWDRAGLPSWSYRFDVTVNGINESYSATHFQEVAFVFYNLNGDGYTTNPFANTTQAFKDLAFTMSTAWINFITALDPNKGAAVEPAWPVYSEGTGVDVGQNLVFSVKDGGNYLEDDDYRAEAIGWWNENQLAIFGN
ncbi:Alpha/Beta hydrolase protein [Pseudomassariella vexata]|uniref:Carboxylic ester hydrolase n=1 Tax=Pseudomassariella vexata TaxID=1141098 RepID=A0A1Y2DSF2_9PEZI|nr:Alpha/Beta hydrolase protein [Pseudomassariella vexata]ORY62084.1 Alpha/Beta hydrolase protein [Pseudomassariella vexata]